MKNLLWLILLTCSLVGITLSGDPASAQSIESLGDVVPDAVSNDGQIANSGATSDVERDITPNGRTKVGDTRPCAGCPPIRAWIEVNGVRSILAAPPDLASGGFYFGHGVSDDGSLVVGQYFSESSNTYAAVVWENGIPSTLQQLRPDQPGQPPSQEVAWAVSGDGSTAAGRIDYPASPEAPAAVVWQGLGAPASLGCDGAVVGSSTDGSVLVGYCDGLPYRWVNGAGMPLTSQSGVARGVSADGKVVVGEYTGLARGAFIWTEADSTSRLEEYAATKYGLDLDDWSLGAALDISSDGTYIVGTGFYKGASAGYRMELGDCSVSKRLLEPALIRWGNASGGAFLSPGNWEGGEVPGADSVAVFAVGAASYTSSITDDVENARVDVDGDLTILSLGNRRYTLQGVATELPGGVCGSPEAILVVGQAGTSSLTLTNGTVVARGDGTVGRGSFESSLVVSSGATLQMPDATSLWVSESPGSSASVLLEQGGQISTSGQVILARDLGANGTLQVQGVGSILTGSVIGVGQGGTGEMVVVDEGVAEIDFLSVGVDAGSTGLVTIAGQGSVLRSASDGGGYIVGQSGDGEFIVELGGAVSQVGATNLLVGANEASVGRVTIRDKGSSWNSEFILGIANEGEGQFEVQSGAHASFGGLALGGSTTASGLLSVSGADSRLEIGSDPARVEVARGGTARIDVLAGGTMISGTNLILGVEPADPSDYGQASLLVSDTDSRLEVPALVLGERGRGSATVASQGDILMEELWVGFLASVDSVLNTMAVEGGGTVTTQRVFVGGAPGRLDVFGGGQITSDNFGIGINGDVEATVTVEGLGSQLVVNGALVVGVHPSADAVLAIAGGGQVVAGRTTINGLVNGTITIGSAPPKQVEDGLQTGSLWVSPRAEFDIDSVTVLAGGIVGGTGAWPGTLRRASHVAPGDSLGHVGRFTVNGSYEQAKEGSLIIDLGGLAAGEFDMLSVRDTARINGTLEITRVDGFAPQPGSVFEIVRAAQIEGSFDTVLAEDIRVDVLYEQDVIKVTVTSGIAVEESDKLPTDFTLYQNYPNPFNPTTKIAYDLPEAADVSLTVVDVLGRTVRELASGTKPAGTYDVTFDANILPSGVYFYRLKAGDYVEAKRMVVVK